MFCWFQSAEELLESIVTLFPATHSEPGTEEHEATVAQLRAARGSAIAFSPELLRTFNRILSDGSVIEWWGTFDQLCASADQWASDLREQHRLEEETEDPSPEPPIGAAERDGFAGFLEGYGL